MRPEGKDRDGNTATERFAAIRAYFLQCLECAGHARQELYYRPKPGDAREPTEEEVVRRWANWLEVPLNDVLVGIQRGFMAAAERGQIVTSFRYCMPHIHSRLEEMKGSRVGQ